MRRRTESFLISTTTALVIIVVIGKASDSLYSALLSFVPASPAIAGPPSGHAPWLEYAPGIKLLITIFIILCLTAAFAFIENILTDKSSTKYSGVISSVTKRISLIGGQLDFANNDLVYWDQTIGNILIALRDSFADAAPEEMEGEDFSVTLFKPDANVLKVLQYQSTDPLFEPNASTFEFPAGSGFVGVAWAKNFPHSGRRWRRFRRDARFIQQGSEENSAKSFFATVLFMENHNPSERFVLSVASSSPGDFLWYRRHAKSLHYGLQPCLSLLELCMVRYVLLNQKVA